jgi:hypothetical protein
MNQARITAEQSQAVRESAGRHVYLVDDSGQNTSVAIVPVELLQLIANCEFDIAETYAAQEAALSKVWSDSRLDEYTDEDGSPID